jgi:hypothetical protein
MSWGSSSSPPLVSWLARSPGGFPFTFHLLGWEGRRKKVVLEFARPRLAQFIKGGGRRGLQRFPFWSLCFLCASTVLLCSLQCVFDSFEVVFVRA